MLGGMVLSAEPALLLKARHARSSNRLWKPDAKPEEKALRLGTRHRIIQFAHEPTQADLETLSRQGARVLQYIPDQAVLVSGPQEMIRDWARFVRVETLTWADKLSPEFSVSTPVATAEPILAQVPALSRAVVDLHPDVSDAEGRQIASMAGVRVVEHADVAAGHLLVEATLSQLAALAAWDEVAYIFPASPALVRGERVNFCPGASARFGAVGQYVARVGEGWDGPGLGPATIRYVMQGLTAQLPPTETRAELLRALSEWSRVADISFAPGASAQSRTISFHFVAGEHGDGYAFDGRGRVFAHAFYPPPAAPEPLAGDVHLDDAESWRIGLDVDVYSVVLHEVGHSLGLGHSDVSGSVMYPYYGRFTLLTETDIAAIRELYAERSEVPPGTTTSPPSRPIPPPSDGEGCRRGAPAGFVPVAPTERISSLWPSDEAYSDNEPATSTSGASIDFQPQCCSTRCLWW